MKTSDWLRFLKYTILLLPTQVLVINNLELNRFMFPQVYILILLTLPINIKHWVSYLIAFALGFVVDMFTYTPGMHAFSCVMLMFLRYEYFNNFTDKEWLSTGINPDFDSTGGLWLTVYVAIASFIFHWVLFTVENFTFFNYGTTLLTVLYSSSLALFLILLVLFTFRTTSTNET